MRKRRLHPLLTAAQQSANHYRIRPADYGQFNVWRFRDWDHKESGWRIIATTSSREAARTEILERLGLEEPVITITFQPMDQEFTWHFG